MISILLAAALTAVNPVPDDTEQRVAACVGVVTGHLTPQQVIEALKLDTEDKQREFVYGCKMLMIGYKIGSQKPLQTT